VRTSRPLKESHDRLRRHSEDVSYWVPAHRDGISLLFRVRHGCGLGQPFHRDCAIRTTVTRIASQRLLGVSSVTIIGVDLTDRHGKCEDLEDSDEQDYSNSKIPSSLPIKKIGKYDL